MSLLRGIRFRSKTLGAPSGGRRGWDRLAWLILTHFVQSCGVSPTYGGDLSKYFVSETSAHAWADAMEYLVQCEDGKDFNVVINITDPTAEIREVTRVSDASGAGA